MRPRISIRRCVRRLVSQSVGQSVRWFICLSTTSFLVPCTQLFSSLFRSVGWSVCYNYVLYCLFCTFFNFKPKRGKNYILWDIVPRARDLWLLALHSTYLQASRGPLTLLINHHHHHHHLLFLLRNHNHNHHKERIIFPTGTCSPTRTKLHLIHQTFKVNSSLSIFCLWCWVFDF